MLGLLPFDDRGHDVRRETRKRHYLVTLIVGMIAVLAFLTKLRGSAPKAIASAATILAIAAGSIPPLADAMHLHLLGGRDWLVAALVGALAAAPAWLLSKATPRTHPMEPFAAP